MKGKIAAAGCSALILGGYLYLFYRISALRKQVRRLNPEQSGLYYEDKDDEDDELQTPEDPLPPRGRFPGEQEIKTGGDA